MKTFILILVLGVFSKISFAQNLPDCPLGAKEDHLTITRVMRNFGRFSRVADSVALKGINPYEKISNAELVEAAENLVLVISCAQTVLKNPTGDLLPHEADKLTGPKRDAYIKMFLQYIYNFQMQVIDYRNYIIELYGKAPQERDYKLLYKKSQDLNQLIDKAHGDT